MFYPDQKCLFPKVFLLERNLAHGLADLQNVAPFLQVKVKALVGTIYLHAVHTHASPIVDLKSLASCTAHSH